MFGIFDASGCLDSGYQSAYAAEVMMRVEPGYFGDAQVLPTCEAHPTEKRNGCEQCVTRSAGPPSLP